MFTAKDGRAISPARAEGVMEGLDIVLVATGSGSLHGTRNSVAPYGAREPDGTGDPGLLLRRHPGLYSVAAQAASKNA